MGSRACNREHNKSWIGAVATANWPDLALRSEGWELDLGRTQRAKLRTWSATDRLGSSGTPEMRGPMLDSKHPTFGGQKCAPPNRCLGALRNVAETGPVIVRLSRRPCRSGPASLLLTSQLGVSGCGVRREL